jgi:acetyl esterase/lipase
MVDSSLLLRTLKKIGYDTINSELHSKNWGFEHGLQVKFLKAALNDDIVLPIEFIQSLTETCKYFPSKGLEIKRITIPNQFREKAYQFMKNYTESKYGYYPLPNSGLWNASKPLSAEWIVPTGRDNIENKPVVYYVHGGGYVYGHSCIYYHMFRDLTEASNSQVFAVNYRLGPKYTILSMVEDIFAGYFYMMSQQSQGGNNIKNSEIVMAGDSAGGGLILNTLHVMRNADYPIPAGSILISAVTDLTLSQPSMFTNTHVDYLWNMEAPATLTSKGLNVKSALYYWIFNQSSPEVMDRFRKDGTPFGPKEAIIWPEASPMLDTDMENLPPAMIITGDRDSFRDSNIVYGKQRAEAEKKSKKKALIPNVQTYVFDDMTHAFPALAADKYCIKAIKTAGEFIYQVLNANNQQALDSKNYTYIPDYKKSYMESTYNMYWNNVKNQYFPWNSTYPILPFPTAQNLTVPGIDFIPNA